MPFGLQSYVPAQFAQVGGSVTPVNPGFGSLGPDRYGLPGSVIALKLVSGIVFYGLLLCLVGLVLSAGLWAVGSFSSAYTQSVNGKKGFLICVASALAIGAAYFLVEWFYGAGQTVN